MSLRVASTLFVPTSEDTRLIQLCFGDITGLPLEDKVDVILISAFPNDYAPTPGSLIGALSRVLQLRVANLAQNRAEDLRKNFHCWISNSLPEHIPYRQLICFEKTFRDGTSHDQAVAEVFRAMMPVFNNCNKSVITPILATGCQGAEEDVMLAAMLRAAVNWMRAGLPLQILKIVIYTRGDSIQDTNKLKQLFDGFKGKVEKLPRVPQIVAIVYDIFLIYSEDDKQLVEQIIQCFNAAKKGFKKSVNVTTLLDVTVKEASWQYDAVSAMMASTSVVALLTTSFMSSGKCLDQYNLAICADRRSQRHILAPMIFDNLTNIPVYMSSIQWFNCKSREKQSMKDACEQIIDRSSYILTSEYPLSYDVFISYSHRNIQKAKIILHALKIRCPDIRVFFDYDELHTGDKWQLTLYKSMDATKCVIVLVSPDYLSSTVCNEELNLALARHLSTSEQKVEMMLLCVEDVDVNQPLFRLVKPAPTHSLMDIDKLADTVSSSISQWLQSNTKSELFSTPQVSYDINDLNKGLRRNSFKTEYVVDATGSVRSNDTSDLVNSTVHRDNAGVEDVFISCEARDQRYACFLATELRRRGYSVVDKSTSHDFSIIEKAKCVVVMLSNAFQQAMHKIDVLNLALTRLRSQYPVYFITVDLLSPSTPTYISLTQCSVSLRDEFWQEALSAIEGKNFSKEVSEIRQKTESRHGNLQSSEVLALLKAACDIENICIRLDSVTAPTSSQKGCLQDVIALFGSGSDRDRGHSDVNKGQSAAVPHVQHSVVRTANGDVVIDASSTVSDHSSSSTSKPTLGDNLNSQLSPPHDELTYHESVESRTNRSRDGESHLQPSVVNEYVSPSETRDSDQPSVVNVPVSHQEESSLRSEVITNNDSDNDNGNRSSDRPTSSRNKNYEKRENYSRHFARSRSSACYLI